MSQFVVYLKVKPLIAQWLAFHYGTPVRFPDQSAENACIRRFLTRQPGSLPKMQGEGEVAVCIPDSKQKPVITYNHLGIHARAALVDCIEDTFRLQLWHDLNGVEALRCPLLKAVRAWCENNGISIDYEDTVKMRFQRMRSSYLKSGIDLRRTSREKDN